jgi:hypothetical protein
MTTFNTDFHIAIKEHGTVVVLVVNLCTITLSNEPINGWVRRFNWNNGDVLDIKALTKAEAETIVEICDVPTIAMEGFVEWAKQRYGPEQFPDFFFLRGRFRGMGKTTLWTGTVS